MKSLRAFVVLSLLCILMSVGALAAESPPAPAPQVPPEGDPPAGRVVNLVPAVAHRHPRLLFSAQDVPAMKKLAETDGKVFFDQLMAYLPACQPPEKTDFLHDDTDGIRQGMWRMPTVGLHYVLTGDEKSLKAGIGFLERFTALDHWQLGDEMDSGMGSANVMAGVAMLYDWLYNDLDPAFREKVRQKLLLMARRQYYFGHLMLSPATHYWQSDPQNNHRWHRDAGLALAVLGIAGDGPDDQWMLEKTADELEFVADWLPDDGTCHESPGYMVFGGPYVTLALQAADRCLGTHYLDHPFFKNTPLFRLHTLTPGYRDSFPFGDSGGNGFMNNYFFKCTSQHGLRDVQAGLMDFAKADEDAFQYGWTSLVWYDPKLTGGSVDRLATTAFFPDLGIAFMRDGWNAGVGAMFKCGTYGGRKLNEYRNKREFQYINVAHDDPDANMFVVFTGGELVADDDRYSEKKMTNGHNTILVNGKGQKNEGDEWTQPLSNTDMMDLAKTVTWKDTDDVVVAEGEAADMYPDLTRYRRSFIWVRGRYILLLDDIGAAKDAEITWLVQSPEVETINAAQHAYRLKKGAATCDFQVAADCDSAVIVDSAAQSRGRPLGYKQLQLKKKAAHWKLASVFDPWSHRNVTVAVSPASGGSAAVMVTGPGFTDTWRWTAAPDKNTPSSLRCERDGRTVVTVGPEDRAPTEGGPVTR